MYDVSANLLSWLSFLWGLVALLQILFSPYREYTVALAAAVFAIMAIVAMSALETKLTSQSLSKKGRGRSVTGLALALAAILLIATRDTSKSPFPDRAAAPKAPTTTQLAALTSPATVD